MNREEALAVWAPDGSPWNPWTKAVLFSFMPNKISDLPSAIGSTWKVPLLDGVALMIELNGAEGVELGILLARSGYRPVPLYNACPYSIDTDPSDESVPMHQGTSSAPAGVPSVINVVPIMRALERETSTLKNISLPSLAPPAFLLDANRHHSAFSPSAGWFDNRSIVRESDLPSASFLKAQGIKQVILVQAKSELQRDLRIVLLSWQEGGLAILRQTPAEPWDPRSFIVPKPSRLKSWWDKLVLRFGYQINRSSSFGHFVHGSSG